MFDVCVLGLGYIGLPTAAVIAESGLNVLGVDTNENVVDTVNSGSVHIIEPGLEDLVKRVVEEGRLRASLEISPAKVYIIAVPTPVNNDDLSPDLSYVMQAGLSIAKKLEKGGLVILESTSPPGTTEELSNFLSHERPDLRFPKEGSSEIDVSVAYCPERVLPGQVIEELKTNTRIIGGLSQKCTDMAIELYRNFVDSDCLGVSSSKVAEMCKLVENSYRDVNIAFANELSLICHEHGVNTAELIAVANKHPRVNILQPGPGVGGHCIAVDPWFLVHSNPKETRLIRTSREINISKTDWTIGAIRDFVSKRCDASDNSVAPSIAIYGLSFKPNIDDLRESPALRVAENLVEFFGNKVCIVEPNIDKLPDSLNSAELVDLKTARNLAELSVVLVAHDAFKQIKFDEQDTYFAVNL